VAREGWPADAAGLRALPGVGPYTAAAVAAFAFGEPVAAVDVNVARVAARLGRGAPEDLLPAERAADWNQATMELGALVCGARVARCGHCPRRGVVRVGGHGGVPRPRGGGASGSRTPTAGCAGRIVAALAAGGELPAGIPPSAWSGRSTASSATGLVRRGPGGLSLG
jgi:A/G-specific adenine glycosylase